MRRNRLRRDGTSGYAPAEHGLEAGDKGREAGDFAGRKAGDPLALRGITEALGTDDAPCTDGGVPA